MTAQKNKQHHDAVTTNKKHMALDYKEMCDKIKTKQKQIDKKLSKF